MIHLARFLNAFGSSKFKIDYEQRIVAYLLSL